MKYKFGLKLWSTNLNYFGEAERLFKENVFQYIELYAVPGSFKAHKNIWNKLKCPYVIHAPHYKNGVNLSEKKDRIKNLELINDSLYFADMLDANEIILHGGVNGDINETISQIKGIHDSRLVIENKPYFGLEEGQICVGSTPEEIKKIIKEANVGFCMDIGHAVYSANAHKKPPMDYLKLFLASSPIMYHVTDGDITATRDTHEHIGKGNFPLKDMLKLIPSNSRITIETEKSSNKDLDDFVSDIEMIRKVIQ